MKQSNKIPHRKEIIPILELHKDIEKKKIIDNEKAKKEFLEKTFDNIKKYTRGVIFHHAEHPSDLDIEKHFFNIMFEEFNEKCGTRLCCYSFGNFVPDDFNKLISDLNIELNNQGYKTEVLNNRIKIYFVD